MSSLFFRKEKDPLLSQVVAPDGQIDCLPGWSGLVSYALSAYLHAQSLYENAIIHQIKQKFGEMRLNASFDPHFSTQSLIRSLLIYHSRSICEICSRPGLLMLCGNRMSVLCPSHEHLKSVFDAAPSPVAQSIRPIEFLSNPGFQLICLSLSAKRDVVVKVYSFPETLHYKDATDLDQAGTLSRFAILNERTVSRYQYLYNIIQRRSTLINSNLESYNRLRELSHLVGIRL